MRIFTLFLIGAMAFGYSSDGVETSSNLDAAWASMGEAIGVVEGVHVLSGKPCFVEVDYEMPGPTPIRIQRFFNGDLNETQDGFRIFDFTALYEDEAIFKEKALLKVLVNGREIDRKREILCSEPSGSSFVYGHHHSSHGQWRDEYPFHTYRNARGLTNVGSGRISGETNYVNRCVYKKDHVYEMHTGDGSKRYYAPWVMRHSNSLCARGKICNVARNVKQYKNNSPGFSPVKPIQVSSGQLYDWDFYRGFEASHPERSGVRYLLDYTVSPEGHRTEYFYDLNQKLTRLEARSADGKVLYGAVDILHGKDPNPRLTNRVPIRILTSDGKEIFYHTEKLGDRTVLKKVTGTSIPTCEYEYTLIDGMPRLSKTIRPEGRITAYEYYQDGPYMGMVKCVNRSTGRGGSLARVARFEYDFTIQDQWNVRVFDGRGNYSTFYSHRDSEYKIERIEHRKAGESHPYLKEIFRWGCPKGLLFPMDTFLVEKRIEDGANRTIQAQFLTYDQFGNVVKEETLGNLRGGPDSAVIWSDGRWHGQSRVISRSYTQDNRNQLLSEEQDGHKTTYTYDPENHLLTAAYTWDQGRIVARQFYTYDSNNLCISTTEDDGSAESCSDSSGVTQQFITAIKPKLTQPAATLPEEEARYGGDGSGYKRLIERKVYTYNNAGQTIKEEVYDRDDRLRYTILRAYDAHGNCVSETNELGATTEYVYDANDNLVIERLPLEGFERRYTYDNGNRQTKEEHISPQCHVFTQRWYDAHSNVICERDHLGNTTEHRYDRLGRRVETRLPVIFAEDGSHILPVESFKYDCMGNCTEIIHADGSKTAQKFTLHGEPWFIKHSHRRPEKKTFFNDGKVASEELPSGIKCTYTYDVFGNCISTRKFSSDEELLSEECEVHSPFHLLSTIDAVGVKRLYTYDAYGDLKSEEIEGRSGQIDYTYNQLGQQVAITHIENGATIYSEDIEYDLAGQALTRLVKTSNGEVVERESYAYDALGNQLEVCKYHSGGPGTTHTTYDIVGRTTSVVDPEGKKTTWIYEQSKRDPLGRKIARTIQTDPLGRKLEETQDAQGNTCLTQQFDSAGALVRSTKTTYNVMGLAVSEEQDSLSGAPPFKLSYVYNLAGKLTQIIEAPGSEKERITSMRYNPLGQLIQKIKPDGTKLNYSYVHSNLTKRMWSNRSDVDYRYTYDAADRLTEVKSGGGKTLLRRSYDTLGTVTIDDYGYAKLEHVYSPLGFRVQTKLPDASTIEYSYRGGACCSVELSR
jgi:YD repeat-containing protein